MQPGSLIWVDEHACINNITFFDDHTEIHSLKMLQNETITYYGILGTLLAICDAKKIKYTSLYETFSLHRLLTFASPPVGNRDTLESERQFCLVFFPCNGAVWLRRTFCSDM